MVLIFSLNFQQKSIFQNIELFPFFWPWLNLSGCTQHHGWMTSSTADSHKCLFVLRPSLFLFKLIRGYMTNRVSIQPFWIRQPLRDFPKPHFVHLSSRFIGCLCFVSSAETRGILGKSASSKPPSRHRRRSWMSKVRRAREREGGREGGKGWMMEG